MFITLNVSKYGPNNQLLKCCSNVYSRADQRKHQRSASLAFVRGIHRWSVNSPHKWLVTRKENVSIWWRHRVVFDACMVAMCSLLIECFQWFLCHQLQCLYTPKSMKVPSAMWCLYTSKTMKANNLGFTLSSRFSDKMEILRLLW